MKRIFSFCLILSLVALVYAAVQAQSGHQMAQYAQCLQRKGLTMYGADWCPHCQEQKRKFGQYMRYIRYVDCDRNRNLCSQRRIKGLPTLLLSNNREVPAGSLKRVAMAAGCGNMMSGQEESSSDVMASPYAGGAALPPTTGTDMPMSNMPDLDPHTKMVNCLMDKGLTMYGTNWCPHCKKQKKALGSDFQKFTYVDCDKSRKLCREKKIRGYPTWLLSDGTEIQPATLDTLAEQAGCL